jgi:RNA polymerase sigma factor (sigma-70 family)
MELSIDHNPSRDQGLIEGIRDGDPGTMRNIYKLYADRIVNMVKQNSGSEEEGRDLFQEALMVVYHQAQKGLELQASFYTYIYAVSRRLWLKQLRKKSRTGVTLDENWELKDDSASVEEDITHKNQMTLFQQSFKKLGEDCQKVLSFFFEKKSMDFIMEQMGFSSISYTKKRKFQCKEKLVELVKSDPSFEELKV